jgi:glutamyl-tRNA synthetase
MNGVYIRALSQEELMAELLPIWQRAGQVPDPVPDEVMVQLCQIAPLVQERLKRLSDAVEMTDFFFDGFEPLPAEKLVGKKMDVTQSLEVVRRVREVLEGLQEFNTGEIEDALRGLVEEMGLKNRQVFGVTRAAVTGKQVSPPLFGTLSALGQQRALERLGIAERTLESAQRK